MHRLGCQKCDYDQEGHHKVSHLQVSRLQHGLIRHHGALLWEGPGSAAYEYALLSLNRIRLLNMNSPYY